jgi:hypothetical protein
MLCCKGGPGKSALPDVSKMQLSNGSSGTSEP